VPTEFRFDDLDLREEPARAAGAGELGKDSITQTVCITTTTLPTNQYSCQNCTV